MIRTEKKMQTREPLTDHELDKIFNPERDEDSDFMCTARSYGWEDQDDNTGGDT